MYPPIPTPIRIAPAIPPIIPPISPLLLLVISPGLLLDKIWVPDADPELDPPLVLLPELELPDDDDPELPLLPDEVEPEEEVLVSYPVPLE